MTLSALDFSRMGDLAYQALRDAIFSGEFAQGTRLKQDELARRLGVSRAPIRDALNRLEAEGLVKTLSRAGGERDLHREPCGLFCRGRGNLGAASRSDDPAGRRQAWGGGSALIFGRRLCDPRGLNSEIADRGRSRRGAPRRPPEVVRRAAIPSWGLGVAGVSCPAIGGASIQLWEMAPVDSLLATSFPCLRGDFRLERLCSPVLSKKQGQCHTWYSPCAIANPLCNHALSAAR
jgi:Bacterial regulatory proteins, gntR family